MRRLSFSGLLVFALLTPARPSSATLPEDCPALGVALVDHSCFHTTFGPFKTLLATPGTVPTANTPALDSVHTDHRVGLAGSESAATYAPERSGAWSVFL